MPKTVRLKIADKDPRLLTFFSKKLDLNFNFEFEQIDSEQALQNTIKNSTFHVLLLDINFGSNSGFTRLVNFIRSTIPDTLILPIIPENQTKLIKQALDLELYHYLPKPLDPLSTSIALRRAYESLPTAKEHTRPHVSTSSDNYQGMIGTTKSMRQLFDLIDRVAEDDMSTVLIRGESGTGKEMVAKAIHARSKRYSNNFVPVNCAAIPDELLESELFGYTKGAFTGASANKQGRIQYANKGTLFLDEIGDMKSSLQAKLLRVLQEKEFEPVGALQSIPVDTRILAATHCDLEQLVSEGKFREDLYYRLSVVPINIPPLKDRTGDIPLLITDFLKKYTEGRGRKSYQFSPKAFAVLNHYEWRGNVRELENLIQHMSILYPGKIIEIEDLPEKFHNVEVPEIEDSTHGSSQPTAETDKQTSSKDSLFHHDPWEDGQVDFKELINNFETELILKALRKTAGNKKEAARILNLKRTTLLEKIKKKGIDGQWEG